MRTSIIALLGALVYGCCCCPIGPLREPTPEERAEREAADRAREAETQAAIARALPRAEAFAQAHTLVDPAAAVPTVPCPDAAIEASRGGFRPTSMFVPTIDYGSLPGAAPPTPPAWRWLDNSEAQHLISVHERGDAESEYVRGLVGGINHRYLAVFVHEARELPRVTQPTTLFREGEWTPGSYRGGVYMIDLDASQVICSTPLEATNDADLHVGDDAPEEVLLEDFQEQLEGAATEALQEHTVHFNLNLVGMF